MSKNILARQKKCINTLIEKLTIEYKELDGNG